MLTAYGVAAERLSIVFPRSAWEQGGKQSQLRIRERVQKNRTAHGFAHMTRQSILLFCFLANCAFGPLAADEVADLIQDDFSRYPPGLLSEPIGQIRPAIQEYHYFAHRGVPLEPWANAIGYLDSWLVGDEDGKPYLEQLFSPDSLGMVTDLFSPLFIVGDPEWTDYTVEVSVRPLSLDDMT